MLFSNGAGSKMGLSMDMAVSVESGEDVEKTNRQKRLGVEEWGRVSHQQPTWRSGGASQCLQCGSRWSTDRKRYDEI